MKNVRSSQTVILELSKTQLFPVSIVKIVGNKIHFKQTILNFRTAFAQKSMLLALNRKSEHHHRIQHIQNSTKFQLKQTI